MTSVKIKPATLSLRSRRATSEPLEPSWRALGTIKFTSEQSRGKREKPGTYQDFKSARSFLMYEYFKNFQSLLFLNCVKNLSEGVNINVSPFRITRAFGDGPRNSEPWSSDKDDTCAGTPSPTTTTPTRGRLRSRWIKHASLPYTAGIWWYWARTHDMIAMIRYLDH
ncbi:hypothetical protein TNCV_742381 [Trichonephila clavipes]|nr:hypothetical protein TNCV_742381 [Trichonephila clavipes]